MSQASDIDHVTNGSYSMENGLLKTVNSLGDVQIFLNTGSIDGNKYHYFTYRMLLDHPLGVEDVGQTARLYWGKGGIAAQSDAHFVYTGWRTYTVDLHHLSLTWGTPWQNDSWSTFRLDPNSNTTGQPMTSYIDTVMITADPIGWTNSHVPIRYELSEKDSVVVTLYYDTDTSPGGETELSVSPPPVESWANRVYLPFIAGTGTPDLPQPTVVLWDTTGVSAGSYYILAEVTDGYNAVRWYSDVAIIVVDG